MSEQPGPEPPLDVSALAELALCESLSQTSGWAARWSAQVSGADGALLFAPDAVHPLFFCVGSHGEGSRVFARRSVPNDQGLLRELLHDRGVISIEGAELAASRDPLLAGVSPAPEAALAIPVEAEGLVVAVLVLLFRRRPRTEQTLARLAGFVQLAAPALGRALRAERKTVGMLHAIERLTNLYDLSKAFGSTIDLAELNRVIVRKATDFAAAEVGSLWVLGGDGSEAILAETAVNENYEVSSPPDAVGTAVVGDVLADRRILRRNGIASDDPAAKEGDYAVQSFLALPLIEEERAVGALALVNKRGRHPEFSAEDEELLQDLARQAVRALRNARQHEAEKKVEELDALLTVSREITATLDLDKVMTTIVNATAPLISYDRSAIAILQRGRVRVGAVSGKAKLDRKDPAIQRLQELLEWIYFSGSDVAVVQDADGRIVADRPETEEKFRAYFRESGYRSFYGILLKDEEGKLGVVSFERKAPLLLTEENRDVLDILVNQATVAVRNAQLYQQVPLAGFWKPLLEKRQKFLEIPNTRRLAWAGGILGVLLVLLIVPWRIRIGGPARILPGRRAAATAGVDGVLSSVVHREGDSVRAGDVIATLSDEEYAAALEEARSGLAIAESELSRHREAGDAGAVFAAQSRRDELAAKIALQADQFARTRIRAPVDGIIVTPRIEERVGQLLEKGSELCVVADVRNVTAEVAVDEADASLVKPGQPVALKLNTYPTRTFHGTVSRVGSHVGEDGKERFVIAEVQIENPGAMLKTGMLGAAKVSDGRRPLLAAILRKPLRWAWNKLWPVLP